MPDKDDIRASGAARMQSTEEEFSRTRITIDRTHRRKRRREMGLVVGVGIVGALVYFWPVTRGSGTNALTTTTVQQSFLTTSSVSTTPRPSAVTLSANPEPDSNGCDQGLPSGSPSDTDRYIHLSILLPPIVPEIKQAWILIQDADKDWFPIQQILLDNSNQEFTKGIWSTKSPKNVMQTIWVIELSDQQSIDQVEKSAAKASFILNDDIKFKTTNMPSISVKNC